MLFTRFKYILIVCLISLLQAKCLAQNVLLFVSHENTYYSEYIVMKAALEAAGYSVDVRSSNADATSIYMIAQGGDVNPTIVGVANALPEGSTYDEFVVQFQDSFGGPWDAAYNDTPATVPVNGRIQDVVDMSDYAALVVVGGTGALDYRVDGTYGSSEIQDAAEKLNELALDALQNGKPVMAQCHGASLAAFWRIPGTSGPGEEAMGFSLLKDHFATGFPEPETETALSGLNVGYRAEDRVTVSSPHSSFNDNGNGEFRILTTRDWYPQTVAYAARTLLNILETYPSISETITPISLLIIHGGPVNTTNCGPGNKETNDVPCNYGVGINTPADFTDIQGLLNSVSSNDNYNFNVSELNITDTDLPFDPFDESSIGLYLSQFGVIVFFKHWSTGITTQLEDAIVDFADNGGGVVALHHGLYNDIDGSRNKDILADQLFGAESAAAGWSANLTDYTVYNTNYGHFVSTYGLILNQDAQVEPANWSTNSLLPSSNASFSYYPTFQIYDEIYENMTFVPGQVFGREVNEITPLFSNDQTPSGQAHTTGFVKLFNPTLDATVGRLAYFEIGERKESININHLYGQVLRNAIAWASSFKSVVLGVNLIRFRAELDNEGSVLLNWETLSETNNSFFTIEKSPDGMRWEHFANIAGAGNSSAEHHYQISDPNPNDGVSYYRLWQTDYDGKSTLIEHDIVSNGKTSQAYVYPNPAKGLIHVNMEGIQSIMITDSQGNVLLKKYSCNAVDISSLKPGVYVVQIATKEEELNQVLVKE